MGDVTYLGGGLLGCGASFCTFGIEGDLPPPCSGVGRDVVLFRGVGVVVMYSDGAGVVFLSDEAD